MEEVKNAWGGKRTGAGRPVGTTKEVSVQRPQHQLRAFPDEWELIREFARLVKHVSKEECEQALSDLANGKYKKSIKLD
ncbi:hypothetical protein [uncultured Phascolarctobacterium sp.]|uniref:hypothetical protein n=1 Tax=uncultured Phascolarctobacterium sp. TaxID=512296 RepID=UPI0025CEB619|nr:hypothetical protein [uncultured Phascolarctobacterium sp.]